MIDESKIKKLTDKISEEFPDFTVKFKNEQWFWRVLPQPARKSITTIGETVWFPSAESYDGMRPTRLFAVLAHEYKHMRDQALLGILFFLMYLFPQILFLLAFPISVALTLALGNWFLIAVALSFLTLAPWPSRMRADLEMRGYSMDLLALFLKKGTVSNGDVDRIVSSLTGWTYYKMIWTQRMARRHVLSAIIGLDNVDDWGWFEAFLYEVATGGKLDGQK